MSLRLLHLANHGGRNIGNAALINGAERLLAEDVPAGLDFVPEPWDLYSRGVRRFDAAFVERVNECDALLVNGAVSFDGNPQYTNTGFRFDLPLDLWREIRGPIVFYGLSHRMFERSEYARRDALRAAVEFAESSDSILFAVRNDGTKQWLEEAVLRRASERVHVVPDPGLFVPVEDAWHPELDERKLNVLVAVNAEDEPFRWGRAPRRRTLGRPAGATGLRSLVPVESAWSWRETRRRFVRSLATALDHVASRGDVHLVFCSHDLVDVAMGLEVWDLLSDSVRYDTAFTASHLLPSAGPRFYDLYAKADLAISMRIHSMNPAIGIGTPAVPIVTQSRMRLFMADAGLSDLSVDGHADDVTERIAERAAAALDRPDELRARFADVRGRMRRRAAEFNARVAALLEAA